MECNRDVALRAREIAERKFTAKDILGAKKFALKAQNLDPDLDGISQMIATLDVYLSAEAVFNGERDWYAVLSVNASADEEMVKKQYRKLALMLHPDKNQSIGAEGAFKLVSEAWSVLSDRTRRMAYDQKRNIKMNQQKASHPYGSSNGFYHFASSAASNLKTQKSTARSRTAPSAVRPPAHPSNPNTFWTSCNRCKMQYEYLRVYLNHNLLCPNCCEPFLAVEIGNPTNAPHTSVPRPSQHRQHPSNHHKNSYGHGRNSSSIPRTGSTAFHNGANLDAFNSSNFYWGAFSRNAGAASAAASSTAAAQAANMVHQTYEKVKREREEKQAAARRNGTIRRKIHVSRKNALTTTIGDSDGKNPVVSDGDKPTKKRRSISEDSLNCYRGSQFEGKANSNTGSRSFISDTGVSDVERATSVLGDSGKAKVSHRQIKNLSRELPYLDIQNMLMQKAKSLVQGKLDCWSAAAATKLAETEKPKQKQKQKQKSKQKYSGKEKETAVVPGDVPDKIEMDESSDCILEVPSSGYHSVKEVHGLVSIDVPDPDFHDFDKERSEKSFEPDQVWATYDNEDGMPRFYVLIQKVLSLEPFKIRMSFLNSKSNSELGPLNWVGMGFAKTCGEFRVGSYKNNDSINIFSHRVRWEKGTRGVIKIIPRKGDIWALYRNWTLDWNERTPDDVVHKYDMVEVLDDYNEEQGVVVAPLVKVSSFKTVFQRLLSPNEVKRISREEMLRFSHQVPAHLLSGEEALDAPKGCYELDPAATPVDLHHAIKEAKEDEVVKMSGQEPIC